MPPKDTPTWNVFLRGGTAEDANWELRERRVEVPDPCTAARIAVSKHWASGSHSALVVGDQEAFEFRITVETDEVLPSA